MKNFSKTVIFSFAAGMTFGFGFTYLVFTTRSNWNLSYRKDATSSDIKQLPTTTVSVPSDAPLNTSLRLLCMIITQPKNHEKKALHVRNTWGRRCGILLFMSTEQNVDLPTIKLGIPEGRSSLWGKTKLGFRYIYDNYLQKADWFLKADDDTYIIVENLMHMLSAYDTSKPLYFGSRLKLFTPQGYMSGGAGYILSREAVRKFVQGMGSCRKDNKGAEDVELGRCLQKVGVKAGDSRDRLGRRTFFPVKLENLLIPKVMNLSHWFWSYSYYPLQIGEKCCSDVPVSFHYIAPHYMELMDYFIYRIHVYGRNPL